ncbi:hypothetical protein H312_01076 [Anncaliia algerae PRA339]|uniref:Uncharacterized protein n=1 Tax=Anncaliia algerae PRA339 TaxID=1288291 RepID=A0A059F2K8_9MICR|nr:hypothetical protein H312_01076 [Anncaliia algerae PRA339]
MQYVNCSHFMELEQFNNDKDGKTWRCNYNLCTRTRTSIRKGSFL